VCKAIEKLLEAKELNLNTYPFSIERNEVILTVKDEEKEEEFCITLAEFRADFKNKGKVYSHINLCEHDWEEALIKTCQDQIDKYWDRVERKDKLVAELRAC
jgi:uncharacterized damage-inducible protein DinB